MIQCALNQITTESKPVKISLAALIKECNEKIIKEKEILYNFKFSSDLDQVLTDIEKKELIAECKEKENVNNNLCSNNNKKQIIMEKQVSHLPNIFKERVKSFLKNKNLF